MNVTIIILVISLPLCLVIGFFVGSMYEMRKQEEWDRRMDEEDK